MLGFNHSMAFFNFKFYKPGIDLNYAPKEFCREYYDLKQSYGHGQLVQFMATVLGIKPAFDDWFPYKHLSEIERICRKYHLYYKIDWVFRPCDDVSGVISGGNRLSTTKMYGVPLSEARADDGLHIFFSTNKDQLEYAYRNGWYPLILGNRAIHKPYIDHMRFGESLGYPPCCIDFFRRFNNKLIYNNLYETLRNTNGKSHKFCNSILKDNNFSYIYYMPCSWNCKRTRLYVHRLRNKMLKLEPDLVQKIDTVLALPVVVFDEQFSYVFQGEVKENRIEYSDCKFVGVVPNDQYSDDFAQGDSVIVYDNRVEIFNKNQKIKSINTRKNAGFIINFGD